MIDLSPDQAEALDMIEQWFDKGGDDFRLGGLAGTGKTTIVTQLPRLLDLKSSSSVAFVAPTGKAASVLSRKLEGFDATTIHQLIYRPMMIHCGACPESSHATEQDAETECHGENSPMCHMKGPEDNSTCKLQFRYAPPEDPPQLIVVDEASMVGGTMFGHLKDVGSQLLFVGDHGQLSPIDSVGSVMDEVRLDIKLERIHRQAAGNPILKLAMLAREGKRIVPRKYGDNVECLLGSKMMSEGFDADNETMLICYTNEMRKKLNALVRRGMSRYSEDPVPGDRVICLKNHFASGVANGMLGTVIECQPRGSFYYFHIKMDDHDMPYKGVCSMDQFHEVPSNSMARHIRGLDMWTWGYALTAHKAQGSESNKVIIFQEEKMKYMKPMERRRWMYTAITRAKKQLIIYTPIFTGG